MRADPVRVEFGGTIAAAVYAGHRLARKLDAPLAGGVPFRLQRVALEPEALPRDVKSRVRVSLSRGDEESV